MNLVNHRQNSSTSLYLLGITAGLFLLGAMSIFGVSKSNVSDQLIFYALFFVIYWILQKLDFDLFSRNHWLFFALGIIALILTLFVAPNVRGAHRWLDIFGFRLQTSEIFKPFFILTLANVASNERLNILTKYIIYLALGCLTFVLVLVQPDLGTTILFFCVWLVFFVLVGLPKKVYLFVAITLLVLGPFIYNFGLRDYQKSRITAFLNPEQQSLGANYNVRQAIITIGSGGVFGNGMGRGSQTRFSFLPEDHTDFIFSSLIEQFGAFGGMILLGLYLGILRYIFWGWKNLSLIKQYFRLGVAILFFVSAIINIAMNLGLAPVTGITLPLISYGGSSIISFAILFALIK